MLKNTHIILWCQQNMKDYRKYMQNLEILKVIVTIVLYRSYKMDIFNHVK